MVNTPNNYEELRKTFESLPIVDDSRSNLRIINFEVLKGIVDNATKTASLKAGIESFTKANDIIKEVFSKSFPSL
jgi:hypothetical protein